MVFPLCVPPHTELTTSERNFSDVLRISMETRPRVNKRLKV